MKFKEKTILFRTIVGSHMWGQHHSKSDTDKFEVYIFDSRSFLLGNRHDGCHRHDADNVETQSCEIGHVIRELLKGNVNFLWGVMSPKIDLCVTNIDPTMWNLRKITRENISRATVHSIRGFAIHNLKHWFGRILDRLVSIDGDITYITIKKKEPRLTEKDKKYWKILNTCARTLGFGIKLLSEGVLDFENPIGARTIGDIISLLNKLEKAYKESALPDKPDPKPFEEFLLWTRISDFARVRNR